MPDTPPIQPLRDTILVKPEKFTKMQESAILNRSNPSLQPEQGVIIELGPDVPKGVITVGQTIIFSRFSGNLFEIGKDEYFLLELDDCLGVVR